jgi:DNA-binding LytR/AlgR family response regulator
MKNILIVEDDAMQRKNLKEMLQLIDEQFQIYEAEDADEALEISKDVNIDLFFVDIFLKNSSGLEFAIDIRKITKYEFSFIVFITTQVEYLTQAFKQTHCYDYILKPYDKDEIIKMVKKFSENAKNNSKQERKSVAFDLKNRIIIKMYIDEIIFVEANMRTCIVNTVRGRYMVNKIALKKVLELIDCEFIIQSHKSFLVNTKYINKFEKIDSRTSKIYFENYEGTAYMGYKYRDTLLELIKR